MRGPAAVTLASSMNPAPAGTSLTFTASATSFAVYGPPTGTVTFFDGAAAIATVPLDASGTAVWNAGPLGPGLHPITATYNGDATHAPRSKSLSQQITGSIPAIDRRFLALFAAAIGALGYFALKV